MADEKILTLDNYIYIASEEEKIYAKKTELPSVPVKAVSKNGTAITPDANGTVDVTVPTATSQITNDSDFVSDASYVHTDSNYTSTEKTKLAGIEEGAQANDLEGIMAGGSSVPITNKVAALGSAATASTEATLTNGGNLPTGAAVKSFVEGKGYTTQAEVQQMIDTSSAGALTPSGSIAPASITSALLVEANLGNLYNLSADMTLDATTAPLFTDGAVGEKIAEGTNIQIVKIGNSYLFDAMAGFIDLSGYAMKSDIQYATNAEIAAAMGYPTA